MKFRFFPRKPGWNVDRVDVETLSEVMGHQGAAVQSTGEKNPDLFIVASYRVLRMMTPAPFIFGYTFFSTLTSTNSD